MTTVLDHSPDGETLLSIPPRQNASSPTSSLLARSTESMLYFCAAIGSTLSWIAVLSNVVIYTNTLGADSYLYLQLVLYVPLLPVTMAQAFWDAAFDHKYPVYSYWFRAALGYGSTVVGLLLLPNSRSLVAVCTVNLILGMASAVLQGMLKQMGSSTICCSYATTPTITAAVTAGQQAAAIVCGMVALGVRPASGNRDAAQDIDNVHDYLQYFYRWIAFLVFICWTCCQGILTMMLRHRPEPTEDEIDARPATPPTPELTAPLLPQRQTADLESISKLQEVEKEDSLSPASSLQQRGGSAEQEADTLTSAPISYTTLWSITWRIGCCLGLTVASSMAVASWFNRIPSSSRTDDLAQTLVYTRLIADLFGRPLTLWRHVQVSNTHSLVKWTVVRVAVGIPLLVAYCATDVLRNDTIVLVGVALFSLSSGFLATSCYQSAPKELLLLVTLPDDDDDDGSHHTAVAASATLARQQQTNMLNVCFSFAVCLGLLASCVVRFLL